MDPIAEAYADEIRSWLVGRVERRRGHGTIVASLQRSLPERALFWWIFEGKRYPWLEGPLCSAWPIVERHARRLLETHNPIWRRVDLPEGETDWLSSLVASLTSDRPVFVSRASHAGLNEPEHEALLGWLGWIEAAWNEYVEAVGAPDGVPESLPWVVEFAPAGEADDRVIRRWAHIARRSRWPLMRNVVAESLRCTFEEQLIDRLPLPSDHATLFELLCMVRILGALEPEPDHVRWLDYGAGGNKVEIAGMRYSYQHPLSKSEMLATREFDNGLREAVVRHEVRVPMFADGWLAFDEPRGGFAGILLEAKSGAQPFDAAVHQLKCYRAALKLRFRGRILVWGVAEQADDPGMRSALHELRTEVLGGGEEDVWVFLNADMIPDVLQAAGMARAADSGSRAA